MKRTEKKKLVLTKVDVRTLVLTPMQLQHVVGATGNHPCGNTTPLCKQQF